MAHPEPLLPVTAEGTELPCTLELYDNVIGTSLRTPGNVNNWSVNNAFPVPTSTDNDDVPDIENGNNVAP